MSTFVLEIGTEELPARFLSNVEKELADRFTAGLKEAGYTFSLLDTCATPRRSVVIVEGLEDTQPVREELLWAARPASFEPRESHQGQLRGCQDAWYRRFRFGQGADRERGIPFRNEENRRRAYVGRAGWLVPGDYRCFALCQAYAVGRRRVCFCPSHPLGSCAAWRRCRSV